MWRPVYVNDHIRLALGKARQRELIEQADKARLVKRTGPGLTARALESLRHRTTKRTRQGPIPLNLAHAKRRFTDRRTVESRHSPWRIH